MNDNNDKKRYCPNCGAPLTSEICPYCNGVTGVETSDLVMEYPVIQCKEANLTFITSTFFIIFGAFFILIGVGVPLALMFSMNEIDIMLPMVIVIFGSIGLGTIIFGLNRVIRNKKVKTYGKEIDATVYGYMNDQYQGDAEVVKLLVDTNEGKKFILYQTGENTKPYKINSTIKLLVYKDMFLIKEDNKYYFQ